MKITVNANNITDGIANSTTACPIAKALIESGHSNVAVISRHFYCLAPDNKPICGSFPSIAEEFISNFDLHKHVSPIEFEVELCK